MAEWIFPSNLGFYRADDAFRELKTIDWVQNSHSKNVKAGDTVYIYFSSPISAIRWQCVVNESHKNPGVIDDGKYYVPPMQLPKYTYEDCIELCAVREFDVGPLLDYNRLKENGLKSRLMGPLMLKDNSLIDYIHKVINTPDTAQMTADDAQALDTAALTQLAKKYSRKAVKTTVSQTQQYVRNPYIAEYAKRRANGICQLCGNPAPFTDTNGKPYLESHHIEWLSKGGEDSIENTVAICPNCHRKIHVLALTEDVKKLKKSNILSRNTALVY